MKIYDWSKTKVEKAVKNNCCYADTLRDLGIPVRGRNSDTLKSKIKEYSLDTSHFTFVSKNKGVSRKKDISEYLVKGSNIKTCKLKDKLFESGLKENKCEICGTSEWLGRELKCQLHHIDGDETNNELSNLQILCPNCHSQTENYCGNANKIEKEKHYCKCCGRELKSNNSELCVSCAAKKRTADRLSKVNKTFPTKEELKLLIKTESFTTIGKLYGVTDNAIRKWCKKFNLPYSKTELGLINLSKIPNKTCEECGKEFKPKSRNQRFCSKQCQMLFYSKHGGSNPNNPILEDIITKDDLLNLHKSKSWAEIAKYYNITKNQLNALRKKYNIYKENV